MDTHKELKRASWCDMEVKATPRVCVLELLALLTLFRVSKARLHLKREGAGVLGDQEVTEVLEVRRHRIQQQQGEEVCASP